jgi:hypothetical protein
MTISDDQIHHWIASLVERTGGQLRAELDGFVRQVQARVPAQATRAAVTPLPSEDPTVAGDHEPVGGGVSGAPIERTQGDVTTAAAVLDAMSALDAAPSLSDILEVLVDRAALHAGRVLLVIRRGTMLTGWRWRGYTPDPRDATMLEIGLADSGLVARAASAGRTTSDSGLAGDTAPAASCGENRAAIAVPLRVGGDVVAVLYADEEAGDAHRVRGPWPEVIGMLAAHAARCLECMTARRLGELVAARAPGDPPALADPA